MKRKVVRLGPATLVVSLPSKWIKKYNINSGDELELDEEGSNLLIQTQGGMKKEKAIVDVSKVELLMKRIIVSKYIKGNDEIEVKVDSLQKSRAIQKRVDELIGVEIIEQGKDYLIIKDIGGLQEDNFDSIIRRVFHLLHTISDEVLQSIQNKDVDLEYLLDAESNVNKFTDYAFRLLSKKGYTDPRKTASMYCIIFLLEELGDEYKHLISYINNNKLKLNKELTELFEEINSYHNDFERLFLNFNYPEAIKLATERDNIMKEINNLLSKSKNKEDILLLKHFEQITETIVKSMGQLLNLN